MVDRVVIQKINNGYVTQSNWLDPNSKDTVYHSDWISIIKHLDTVYGGVEREIQKLRAETKK